MSLTPDPEATEATEDQTVHVSLEIFPEDGTTVELRQIAVGLHPAIILGTEPVEDGDTHFTITLSACTPEVALEVLGLATLSLHNYLGSEGK